MIVAEDVLKVISDKESLELFRIVALTKRDNNNTNNNNTDDLMNKTKLTSEQYYSRISTLSNAGLIKSKNGKHTLSAFGKVAFYALTTIENGASNYWKLKTIDSLEDSDDLPAEERKKLIDNLIDNQEIKDILVSYSGNNNINKI
jgi:predicted transcriptional regulator